MSEPSRLGDDQVEIVAVHDQIFAAVGALVHRCFDNLNSTEMGAVIIAQKLVVVTWDIDQASSLPRLAEQLLHDVIVGLWPIPAGAKLPAVDDIADQINNVGIMIAQEVENTVGLASPGSKVQIGNK